jgi:hypothetical protein
VPGLYAWLRRNPRLVDGALALLLVFPGGSIPKLGILRTLAILPFILGMAVPVVFRRAYPVEAFAVVIAVGALQVLLLRRRRPGGAGRALHAGGQQATPGIAARSCRLPGRRGRRHRALASGARRP